MAVLRNPVLFVLFALMAGGGYIVVQLGLLGPIIKVTNAAVEQGVELARVLLLSYATHVQDQLRNFVHPPGQHRQLNAPHSQRTVSEAETIVMDDLDQDGKRKGYKSEY